MTPRPSFAEFSKSAATADFVPVYRRVLGDSLTPVSALHKLEDGGTACLFESVIGGEKVGRYSFLATSPFLLLEAYGQEVRVTTRPEADRRVESFQSPNPIEELRRRVAEINVAQHPDLPPFVGGAVGFAGYDTVRYVEHLPDAPSDDRQLPDLSFAFFDHMVVFDNVQKTVLVIALADARDSSALTESFEDATSRIDGIVARLGCAARRPVSDRCGIRQRGAGRL